ncbi:MULTISPECIES: LacI family DNA-binding transcriptional regulator [unclassified Pseudoxanthomonas]|uniref:LacI family DNA-binding transcriptional regulator n=1 Tax=unclassified Pseudoxanthomonas TaxID=2645906 RepID=UPI0008F15E58|nr:MULTISPECIES: LacI family DNA-binding transcriptional regulator [unclassified Pseudoxanthomonas]PPJ41331.1 LacI family DNA-binding transcriptional regulator [Pseudoxanthomonas sp. KAs_5_3]SFV30599.1 transcriptional regulator, LacI family [Pseudoxanthomonas sp. YR558]
MSQKRPSRPGATRTPKAAASKAAKKAGAAPQPKAGKPAATERAREPQRVVTVTDIANAIGVSRATVSLVLRGSPLVHVDTRARVEAELKRQRYVYNRGAANLRRRTSSSVALVINDLANPFFAEFAAGVDEALGEKGFVTLLGSTGESPERQQAVLSSLMEHTPAGVILSPAEGSDATQLHKVLDARANVLLFNRELTGADDWGFLGLDNQHGAQLATEHLISQGHRRIAFYGGHADSSSCRQRRAGHAQAMRAAGLPIDPAWLIESAPNRLEAAARTGELFGEHAPPTAAVCYNDTVALGLMLGLVARGIQPGRGFAVTGFDDIPEAAVSTPPLTTLAAQPRERGRQAAQLVLRQLEAGASPRRTIAPVTLSVRESSGARQK